MSGLSPDALCRNVNNSLTQTLLPISRTLFVITEFKLGLNIRFDAIKNLVARGTVCTKPLRMCSFLWQLLIRLYEFLKNSRESFDSLSIDLYQPTPKQPFCKASLVLNETKSPDKSLTNSSTKLKQQTVLVEDDGIEPTTPCLQSRCSPSWANPPYFMCERTGGSGWARTNDPRLIKTVL